MVLYLRAQPLKNSGVALTAWLFAPLSGSLLSNFACGGMLAPTSEPLPTLPLQNRLYYSTSLSICCEFWGTVFWGTRSTEKLHMVVLTDALEAEKSNPDLQCVLVSVNMSCCSFQR